MKFEKLFFILFSLLLLAACSDYVEKYEGDYKEAYGDEATFIDNLNNFEWEWSATCETGNWLWCASKNGKVATSQAVSLTQFTNGSVGLIFTAKDNNAYNYSTNTLPQDLTPLIRRNGGVSVKVENTSGVFEAGIGVSLEGINLADIEKYRSIVIAYANEYPGAYLSLREVVSGEVVSEWRWKLDKGDVSTKALAFADLEYVKGEVDLPAFLAKVNMAAFVLTEDAAVTKGLTIVAVGFGNMGESYSSIYPISSASTTASSASVRVSSSSRPPNSSASVYFNCSDPSSMSPIDFARICAVSSSSARSSSSNATVRSSSSARSSSSVVKSSSSVAVSSSSEADWFHWKGLGHNDTVETSFGMGPWIVYSDVEWSFADSKTTVLRPEGSPMDTCNGMCGLILYNYESADSGEAQVLFNLGNYTYDVSDWGGLCITYYSDNDFVLRLVPSNAWDDYRYDVPRVTIPAVPTDKNDKYNVVEFTWDKFEQSSNPSKNISGTEVAKKLQTVELHFRKPVGTKQFFNIYEIGSLGQCGKDGNVSAVNIDKDYFDYMQVKASDYMNPDIQYDSIYDSRSKRYYRTVKINDQTWMAENLNYKVPDSYCYDDREVNCNVYGRLYTWAAVIDSASLAKNATEPKECGYMKNCNLPHYVQGICPDGWRVPNKEDFYALRDYVGGYDKMGGKLKSLSGWKDGGDGIDKYGFSALPGGYAEKYENSIDYRVLTVQARFWSSTQGQKTDAYQMRLYNDNESGDVLSDNIKNMAQSLRCIKTEPYASLIDESNLIWYGGNKMSGGSSYLKQNLLEAKVWIDDASKEYIKFASNVSSGYATDKLISGCGGAVCGNVDEVPDGTYPEVGFTVATSANLEEWGGICVTYKGAGYCPNAGSCPVEIVLETDADYATTIGGDFYHATLDAEGSFKKKCFSWLDDFKQDGTGSAVKLDAYLRKVKTIGFKFNKNLEGLEFNIAAIGTYTAKKEAYDTYMEDKDHRTSAWEFLNPGLSYGTFTDERDNQVYKSIKIGDQTWMAENLNYDVEGSTCNGNCNIYGRLYKPALAATLDNQNNLCPHGWRLPTEDDFLILIHENHQLLGSPIDSSAAFLKARRGWRETSSGADGNGTDLYGFSAIAANGAQETFMGKHINGDGTGYVYNVFMILTYQSVDASVGHGGSISDGVGYPIRCISDDPTGVE